MLVIRSKVHKCMAVKQTVKTLTRLLLQEQSDLGLHCLSRTFWKAHIVLMFLFLFLNKIMIIRAGIHKMHVKIENRKTPDQTAASEAV